ncbi:YihY/virulence factor BrkB family protein [Streptomyces sodiiphilus]|uniref:YihY/virulence factor BrkB family protein n=1 Tax=Streptomyces sodiiphilus TaxID=226217 RepID=A0ABN2NT20_9ACTN
MPAHTSDSPPPRRDSGSPPGSPVKLPKGSWKGVLKRTVTEFKADNLIDWAAALTYYGVLSIFPALLALVSVLGLLGSDAIDPLIENVGTFAPDSVQQLLTEMLGRLRENQATAGVALITGLAVALWSASGYVAGFMRASNAVYDIGEGRPVWKTLPIRVGVTLVLVVLLAASAIAVVLTGTLARQVGDVIGLGETAVRVWDIAKWPVLVLLVAFMIGLLFRASPNARQSGMPWVSPGSLLAVLIWIIASAAFAFYVGNFGNYNQTYGSIAGVIIFLIWLWISNIAILLGHKFNAELERARAIATGHPPEEEPYVEPRDTRKLDD